MKQKHKCLYYKCNKELKSTKDCPKPLWCSMECKEQFYIEQYLGSALASALEYKNNQLRKIQKENAIRKLKIWQGNNPGKGVVEYLHSL